MAERRRLSFANLDDVLHDVAVLRLRGYEALGRWNLGQICAHLDDWMRYPLDGYPRTPLLMAPVLWSMRVTVGPGMLRKILESGRMSNASPTLPVSVHGPEEDETAAVERLTQTIRRFRSHRGKFLPSPLFGPLSPAQADLLQRIHAAHHLSFLVPLGER
ncbi:MAG TPA: hypothetical protein DCQ98_16615 [Planctomycetaceae bacterium]|nr:hypothetical protein [Planctomycetaceae bacterium]HRF01044.1 DUF1569 domain-containing protein [Pirellulaceae bacterium]